MLLVCTYFLSGCTVWLCAHGWQNSFVFLIRSTGCVWRYVHWGYVTTGRHFTQNPPAYLMKYTKPRLKSFWNPICAVILTLRKTYHFIVEGTYIENKTQLRYNKNARNFNTIKISIPYIQIGTTNMVRLKPEDFTDSVVTFQKEKNTISNIRELKRLLNENPENPGIGKNIILTTIQNIFSLLIGGSRFEFRKGQKFLRWIRMYVPK